MKIILAPDSFKGCLRSPEICRILEKSIKSVLKEAKIVSIPMADGGEGTLEAIMSARKGRIVKVKVEDPLGRTIEAKYGIAGKTAVMEMASASGIELLKKEELNPLIASTFGTGQLLKAAINAGYKDIVMGIGGSATVDGGAGMLQALGFKLLDKSGNDIERGGGALVKLSKIEAPSDWNPKIRIRVACDVKNPLLGPDGAVYVFGPQKGADKKMLHVLEKAMANYAEVLIKSSFSSDVKHPGDGAAGGLGTALRTCCKAEILPGAALIMDINNLQKELKTADFIITGEGCTDSQTFSGKLCSVIAQTAKAHKVPVIVLSGALNGNLQNMHKLFDAAFSISSGPMPLEQAIKSAPELLAHAGRNIASIIAAAAK